MEAFYFCSHKPLCLTAGRQSTYLICFSFLLPKAVSSHLIYLNIVPETYFWLDWNPPLRRWPRFSILVLWPGLDAVAHRCSRSCGGGFHVRVLPPAGQRLGKPSSGYTFFSVNGTSAPEQLSLAGGEKNTIVLMALSKSIIAISSWAFKIAWQPYSSLSNSLCHPWRQPDLPPLSWKLQGLPCAHQVNVFASYFTEKIGLRWKPPNLPTSKPTNWPPNVSILCFLPLRRSPLPPCARNHPLSLSRVSLPVAAAPPALTWPPFPAILGKPRLARYPFTP